jgi:hypothetical protein
VKNTEAPIGEEWSPKNRNFWGYFDPQKNEILAKNQHSPILRKFDTKQSVLMSATKSDSF